MSDDNARPISLFAYLDLRREEGASVDELTTRAADLVWKDRVDLERDRLLSEWRDLLG